MQEAVTLPDDVVTAFHTIKSDLALPLPWPRPNGYEPSDASVPILIWGGSSLVGQYALQLLKHYGYRNLLTTASKKQHEYLKSIGAAAAFDCNDPDVTSSILHYAANDGSGQSAVPLVFDCIGSQSGSFARIARIAQRRTKIAVLLPVIIRDSTEATAPEYSMDAQGAATWADGVDVRGVRTHCYLDDAFLAEHLQPEIMPALLADGVIAPNKQRVVEGSTLLGRAQAALDPLGRKEVSGERLVWQVAD